jgi:circadian clock protein KaiB
VRRRSTFKFRLYVAGNTQNSAQARANLEVICRDYLPDRHELEIVDVLKEPTRALSDGIFMTPMLVKLAPSPGLTIVGTLSQMESVLQALGLEHETAVA